MKNPWPVVITVICVVAFLAAASVVVIMVRQKVELVTPDYYEQDLKHNDRMAQEQRAFTNAVTVRVAMNEANEKRIVLTFPGPIASGTINLYRPSDMSMDQHEAILLNTNHEHILSASSLAAGLWRVKVQWLQDGQEYYFADEVIMP